MNNTGFLISREQHTVCTDVELSCPVMFAGYYLSLTYGSYSLVHSNIFDVGLDDLAVSSIMRCVCVCDPCCFAAFIITVRESKRRE